MMILRGYSRLTSLVLAMLLGLICAPARLPGAQHPAVPDFAAMIQEARGLQDSRRFDEAYQMFDAVRVLARGRHEDLWEARAMSGLASVCYSQAKYPLAKEKHLESLAVFERLGALEDQARANLSLGNVAWYLGDLAEARTRYRTAISLYDALGAVGERDTSILNLLRTDAPSAPERGEMYRQLESDAVRTGDTRLEASVLHSWGDWLFNLANYREAVLKLQRAESLYRQVGAQDPLATVYNSLGRIYRRHGQNELALDFQLRALAIQEALHATAGTIQSLNAVAVTYESLGKREVARSYYERAIRLAEQTGAPRIQDFLRANLAESLFQNGEFAAGAQMLEQVLSRRLDTHTATRYDQLSFAYLHLGRIRDALDAAQKAVDSCRSEGEASCLYARSQRAQAYLAMGNKPAAKADLQTALATIEDLHTRLIPEDFLKQRLHQSWEPLYSLAIELNYREGKGREALETAELARSRAFLDLLAGRQLDVNQSGDSGDQRQARPVPAPSSALQNGPVSSGASGASGATRPVAATRAAHPQPVAQVPRFRSPASPVAAPTPTARDIGAIAARLQSTIVAYWAAADAVYIWVVDQTGVLCFERVSILRTRLQALVQATSSSAAGADAPHATGSPAPRSAGNPSAAGPNADPNPWSALYGILIRPVRKSLPQKAGARLTVVPHGPLLNLSFAALRDPEGHYLVEHYTLHFVPASAVLQYAHANHPTDARTGSVLMIADPAAPSDPYADAPLARLPGARTEVEAIARLFPKNQATLLVDKDATAARVRKESAGKTVIHFATHAVVLDGSPFESYLALTGEGNSVSDGMLTAQEIYGLRLNADMIVLSACRSAAGLVTGDGIAALARAFFYAGTSSIVASLWNVPDQPADQLLKDFYRFWLRGEDKDHALRKAQIKLLDNLRNGKVTLKTAGGEVFLSDDPAFWAGFVLLGDPD
jgi:CHAT domain-containing protein/tetratricopeptide (TPR) repeat protein